MKNVALTPKQYSINPTKANTAYKFREVDPDSDVVVLIDLIRLAPMSLTDIAAKAMVNYQTVNNLFEGKTKLPRNTTVTRILGALGYKRTLQQIVVDKAVNAALLGANSQSHKDIAFSQKKASNHPITKFS